MPLMVEVSAALTPPYFLQKGFVASGQPGAPVVADQLAVLSTKMRTFGRVEVNAGLARKMSVSSLTGSNTDQPAWGSASHASAAAARRSFEQVMVCLPYVPSMGRNRRAAGSWCPEPSPRWRR